MASFDNCEPALQYRLQTCNQVKEVSKDFLGFLGITEFIFARFDSNGQHIDIGTNEKWIKFYLENKDRLDISVVDNMWCGSDNTTRFWIWPEPSSEKTDVFRALNEHNLSHGLTVFEKRNGLLSLWAFATTPDRPGVRETYLNHQKDFQSFAREFSERGEDLIENCVKTDTIVAKQKLLKHLHNPVLDAQTVRFKKRVGGKILQYPE